MFGAFVVTGAACPWVFFFVVVRYYLVFTVFVARWCSRVQFLETFVFVYRFG